MAAKGAYIQFSWDITAYRPDILTSDSFSERELRKEYSRLRKIANKRIMRMEKSEFAEFNVVRYNKGKYVPLAEIPTKRELAHLLTDLAKFLSASRGSLTGLREERRKSVETLRAHGNEWATESMWVDFAQGMELLKAFKEYDPSKLAQLLRAAFAQGISPRIILRHLDYYYQWFVDYGEVREAPKGGWDE